MFFPLKDENPTEIRPYFTFGLIAICTLVWLVIQGGGSPQSLMQSVCAFGAIPAEITANVSLPSSIELGPGMVCDLGGLTWGALLSSMFLHGGWMHLIGNMWFLWIFGNNIEDSMGHFRFLAFYLATGFLASAAHILMQPDSVVPTVGASGAISGVMGAYLVLYPKVRVQTLMMLVVFIRVIPLPAWGMLGYWFAVQLISSAATPAGSGGGIAFAAHVGGFVAGVVLIKLFARPQLVNAKRAGVQLSPGEIPHRGWW